jgi:hypothetical protein
MMDEKTGEGRKLNSVELAITENLRVKKAMAVELKENTGLCKEAICRILHLNREEIDWIFTQIVDKLV